MIVTTQPEILAAAAGNFRPIGSAMYQTVSADTANAIAAG